MSTSYDIKQIKNNCLPLMGVAAIWISFFHFLVGFKGFFELFRILGYGGVDIFMFLSGMRMFQSYVKTCDRNIKLFYRRRVQRIIPEYLVFLILGFLIDSFMSQEKILQLVIKETVISTIQNIVMYKWFVPCILLSYLITPWVDSFLFRKEHGRKQRLFVLIGAILLVSAAFWNKSTILMMWIRIPLYVMGYYCSSGESEHPIKHSRLFTILCVAIVVLGASFILIMYGKLGDVLMAEYGIWWYPWIVMTIPMCVLGTKLVVELKRIRLLSWLEGFLSFIGTISFEVYLWQWIITAFIVHYLSNRGNKLLLCFISLLITFLVAYIYKKLFEMLRGKIRCLGKL